MKKLSLLKIAAILMVLLTLAGCAAQPQDNRSVIQQPEATIVVIPSVSPSENTAEPQEPIVTVDKIDKFENVSMTDWVSEQQVMVIKENMEFGTMEAPEFSQRYPTSIYLYDLDTKAYTPLVARKNLTLHDPILSPDKKNLFYGGYSGFDIDDFCYYLTPMDETDLPINLNTLGNFYDFAWFGTDTISVVGLAKGPAGTRGTLGVYTVDMAGKITLIPGTEKLDIITARKMNDKLFYTVAATFHLQALDLTTGEKKELAAEDVFEIFTSPDENQMLIIQHTEGKKRLSLTDADGNIVKTVAEGTDFQGISWSPDQRMVAYQLQNVVDGALTSGLYVYDVVTGQSMQLLAGVKWGLTSWSPSGKKLAVMDGSSGSMNSMIIYFK